MSEQSPSHRLLGNSERPATSATPSTSRAFLPQLVPPADEKCRAPPAVAQPTSAGAAIPTLPPHTPRVVRFSMDEVHLYAQWFQLDVGRVRDVVMQCKGNRELILATLAMTTSRSKPGVSSSSSSGGGGVLLPIPTGTSSVSGQTASPPPLRHGPPSSAGRRSLSDSHQAPLISDDHGVASPRLHNSERTPSAHSSSPHFPQAPLRALSRSGLHSSGGGGAARSSSRPPADDSSSAFRRATWHRERVMSIGALLAEAHGDAGGGLRGLVAALQRDEESSRLWLEDEARTGAVRIWRRSLVWQMNQEHEEQCALIAEETLARGTVVQRQEGTWYRLHVVHVVGVEEMLRYRMLCDYEATSWDTLTRAELQGRAVTGHRLITSEEAWAWSSVFARALELTVGVVRLDRSQVMDREGIECEWVQFALHVRSAGRQLRALYETAVAEQALLATVQAALRGHLDLLEEHQRRTIAALHTAVVGDVVTLLLEPASRAKIWQQVSDGYAQLLELARFHRESVVELASCERCNRESLDQIEAASRAELEAVVEYHALKVRSAAKAARRATLSIPPVLFAASQSLLFEWEASCREETLCNWWRSAERLEELHGCCLL